MSGCGWVSVEWVFSRTKRDGASFRVDPLFALVSRSPRSSVIPAEEVLLQGKNAKKGSGHEGDKERPRLFPTGSPRMRGLRGAPASLLICMFSTHVPLLVCRTRPLTERCMHSGVYRQVSTPVDADSMSVSVYPCGSYVCGQATLACSCGNSYFMRRS